MFTCERSVGHGAPVLLSETAGCSAMFEWATSTVCPPRKMDCNLVSQHLTFDLRSLSSLTAPWKFSHHGHSYVDRHTLPLQLHPGSYDTFHGSSGTS